jgi:hypothetical protein
MTRAENKSIPNDFRAVALDETQYYRIDQEDKKHIKAIFGVYIYNKNEYTHVAEITPSYWLEPLHTVVLFKGRLASPATRQDESLRDELEQKYGYEPMDDTYMHVYSIDAYVKKHPKLHFQYGEAEDIEEVREYWQGNPPF